MDRHSESIIKRSIKDIIRDKKRTSKNYHGISILRDYHEGYAKGTAFTLWQIGKITEEELDFTLELIRRAY